MKQLIREDIFEKVQQLLVRKICWFMEVPYGGLNLKWMVRLEDGTPLFIRQYYPERYKGKFPHLIRAMRLLWAKESGWWVKVDIEQCRLSSVIFPRD